MPMFVHRFNLPFLFWFINCCIQHALRLCYCCCPLAVCLDQLWLILSGGDWTLQMSAYNLLIPFISVCCCWCMCVCVSTHVLICAWGHVCQRQMGMGGCVYVLEMSRSHLHWSLHPTERGGRRAPRLPLCCLPLSFPVSVFSQMLVAFCRCCSPDHLSHTLLVSFSVSHLYIVTCSLCLPIFVLSTSSLNF